MKRIFCLSLSLLILLALTGCTTNKNKKGTSPSSSSDTVVASSQVIHSFESQKGVDESLKEYWPIFTGDFSMFDDDQSNLEYVYKNNSFENGKLQWKYVLMDLNNDGQKELYVKFDPDRDSAVFSYVKGKLKCVDLDVVETPGYSQPLKDGRMLAVYEENGDYSYTFYKYDLNFNYIYQTYFYSYTDINNENIPTKYYQGNGDPNNNAKRIEITENQYKKLQNNVNALIVPENQMQTCSNFH